MAEEAPSATGNEGQTPEEILEAGTGATERAIHHQGSSKIHRVDIELIEDHYTLPAESSTIRFRSSVLKVFPINDTQFVLEGQDGSEEKPGGTLMKRMGRSSAGLTFIRIIYTLIAVFFVGIFAVFCISVLLYIIADLAVAGGFTDISNIEAGTAIGVLLSLPVALYGLASWLVLAGSFALDTWSGSLLLKKYGFNNSLEVLFHWTLFAAFLGIPIFVMFVCLFSKASNWWEITLLTWIASMLSLYLFYAATISYFQVKAVWNLVLTLGTEKESWWSTSKRSILVSLRVFYSGYKHVTFLSKGTMHNNADAAHESAIENSRHERIWPYTRLTMCIPKLFERLDHPTRLPSISEIQGSQSIISSRTWGLDSVYFRPRSDRFLIVVKGPDAVTAHQLRSSIACSVLGNLFIFAVIVSFLVYLGSGAGFIGLIAIVCILFWFIPQALRIAGLMRIIRDMNQGMSLDVAEVGDRDREDTGEPKTDKIDQSAKEDENINHVVYRVNEVYRVTKPSVWFAWFMFAVELIFLYLWPLGALYRLGTTAIATILIVIGISVFLQRFFSLADTLHEVGSIKLAASKRAGQQWKEEARLNRILEDFVLSSGRFVWMFAMGLLVLAFLVACFLVILGDQNAPTDFSVSRLTLASDYEYAVERQIYPMCQFDNRLSIKRRSDGEIRAVDIAYMAYIAYKDTSVVQDQLDEWFGVGNVIDEYVIVEEYRNSTGSSKLPVTYRLLNTGNQTAIVSIRGTQSGFDLFADAKLWMNAALMQILRWVLPVSSLWNSAIPSMIDIISRIQSGTLHDVSYYRETTAFVNFLKENASWASIGLTGHSLGGGLAIISAAQTHVGGVAISGPNAMLSRESFDPKLKVEDLNEYAFNFIPERDAVAHVDDPARLNQILDCKAPVNSLLACHNSERTICELMTGCGSQGRPVPCICFTELGYPRPTRKEGANRTLEEACDIAP